MIKKNNDKKYILVWDLDETLFNTSGNNLYPRPYAKEVITQLGNNFHQVVFTAATKSYADEMLKKMGIYDKFIKLFYRSSMTGGGRYKDLKTVTRELISDKIKYKLQEGKLKKRAIDILSIDNKLLMGANKVSLDKIILIDNLNENLVENQKMNGIIIKDFYGNKKDENGKLIGSKDNALLMIKEFLLHMYNVKPKKVQDYLQDNLFIIDKCIKNTPITGKSIIKNVENEKIIIKKKQKGAKKNSIKKKYIKKNSIKKTQKEVKNSKK